MKALSYISRILVGIVFVFSGFVKIVDPLGSTYKFIDYFNDAFHLPFLVPTAFTLAVIMSVVEILLGILLILNLRMKESAWTVLLFMSFFTPLTFYLAIANPVTDCGCFGDALVITNWETFWKNVIIMFFVLVVFRERKNYKQLFGKIEEWSIVGALSIILIFITLYSYNHLPIVDYRPYHIGTYIPDDMIVPESEQDNPDIYETILIYEKEGVEKEFKLTEIPDSTWKWKSTKNILQSEGYHPPIHDFTIVAQDGDDITDVILDDEEYVFLLISYDITKANTEHSEEINRLYDYCIDNNMKFLCMTSSLQDDIDEYVEKTDAAYKFYGTDEITLKTIVRSNPGLVLLKKGTVIDKWHFNDLPTTNNLEKGVLKNSLLKASNDSERKTYFILMLILALVSTLYYHFRKGNKK